MHCSFSADKKDGRKDPPGEIYRRRLPFEVSKAPQQEKGEEIYWKLFPSADKKFKGFSSFTVRRRGRWNVAQLSFFFLPVSLFRFLKKKHFSVWTKKGAKMFFPRCEGERINLVCRFVTCFYCACRLVKSLTVCREFPYQTFRKITFAGISWGPFFFRPLFPFPFVSVSRTPFQPFPIKRSKNLAKFL